MNIDQLSDTSDVRSWFRELIFNESLSLHPDTDFEEIVDANGAPSYTDCEAAELNEMMEIAFRICDLQNECIYGIAIDLTNEYYSDHIPY